jgi:hypothetical protein
MNDLKGILASTFQQRNSLNALYSKNAFARDLGVSPTALSQFLSGKRKFSPKNVQRVIGSLCLPPESARHFKNGDREISPALKIKMDIFALIAEWYYYAILNLTETEDIKSASHIARRFDIPKEQAAGAVKRLLKLGLLKKQNGVLRRTHKTLDAQTDIPSTALRRHNRQKMEMAIACLDKIPLQDRDVSSMTLPFDPAAMAKIRKEIEKFKSRVHQICASSKGSEVYSLNVQFFPLSLKELKK